MLKENTCFSKKGGEEGHERVSLSNPRLPAVEELTLGLKQKLHLQARARAAPYYIRTKTEPVDLVDRLLEERALVAEAVRRLQALQAVCSEDDAKTRRRRQFFKVDS